MGHGVVTVRAALDGQTGRGDRSRSSRGRLAPGISPRTSFRFSPGSGCNTGGCHGKADGQNGFHLSLFGYDRGRRLSGPGARRRPAPAVAGWFPRRACSSPRRPARVAHGGGRRLTVGSPEYQILLAWVRDGAPERRGKTHGAVVKRECRARRGDPSASPARGSSASSLTMPTATSAT